MDSPPLKHAVEQYERAIADLRAAGEHSSLAHVLAVFTAREAIRARLYPPQRRLLQILAEQGRSIALRKPLVSHQRLLLRVKQLDAEVQQLCSYIQQIGGLNSWQIQHLLPSASDFPPPRPGIPLFDRFDWFCQFGSACFFALSLPFLIDIITRCLTGGIDTASGFAILGAGLLSLLSGGGGLTQIGQQGFDRLFESWNIPKRWWDECRLGVSICCFLLLLLSWEFLLPLFGSCLVRTAKDEVDMVKQENYYHRAIALAPDNFGAHYGLAQLYEKQGKLDEALSQYKQAAAEATSPNEQPRTQQPAGSSSVVAGLDVMADLQRIVTALVDQQEYDKAIAEYKALWKRHKHPTLAANIAAAYLKKADHAPADERAIHYGMADQWLTESLQMHAPLMTWLQRVRSLVWNHGLKPYINSALAWLPVGRNGLSQVQNGIEQSLQPPGLNDLQFYALKRLGRYYLERQDYLKASFWFEQGRNQTLNDASKQYEALYFLGWLFLNQQRYPEAQFYLEQALRRDPESAPAHCLIAQVLVSQSGAPSKSQPLAPPVAQTVTAAVEAAKQCTQHITLETSTADELAWKHTAEQILQRLQAQTLPPPTGTLLTALEHPTPRNWQ